MKIKEAIEKIKNFCPEELACEWDNPGLQIGKLNQELKGIYVTLDVTLEAAKEAAESGCNLIVAHHPLFFSGMKRIETEKPYGTLIEMLIKNDITVYSAHTNMDKAQKGINYVLAQKAGIINPVQLDEFGMIGKVNKISLENYAKEISQTLNTTVKVTGDKNKEIKTCAVCSGSGSDFAEIAKEKGADVLITGDVKYHSGLDCQSNDFCIIDAGHYPTEIIVKDIFYDVLKDCGVKIVKSGLKDVFWYVNWKEDL